MKRFAVFVLLFPVLASCADGYYYDGDYYRPIPRAYVERPYGSYRPGPTIDTPYDSTYDNSTHRHNSREETIAYQRSTHPARRRAAVPNKHPRNQNSTTNTHGHKNQVEPRSHGHENEAVDAQVQEYRNNKHSSIHGHNSNSETNLHGHD